MLYGKIGSIILTQQSDEGWRTKVIERLSDVLNREFPHVKVYPCVNMPTIEEIEKELKS
jgi:hypothetical protein